MSKLIAVRFALLKRVANELLSLPYVVCKWSSEGNETNMTDQQKNNSSIVKLYWKDSSDVGVEFKNKSEAEEVMSEDWDATAYMNAIQEWDAREQGFKLAKKDKFKSDLKSKLFSHIGDGHNMPASTYLKKCHDSFRERHIICSGETDDDFGPFVPLKQPKTADQRLSVREILEKKWTVHDADRNLGAANVAYAAPTLGTIRNSSNAGGTKSDKPKQSKGSTSADKTEEIPKYKAFRTIEVPVPEIDEGTSNKQDTTANVIEFSPADSCLLMESILIQTLKGISQGKNINVTAKIVMRKKTNK